METRETLKEKNTQKRQSRTVSIANKYYLREAVSHLQSTVSYYIQTELGIFT